MKLLLLGSALFSGGVVATESEVVVETVKEFSQQVQNRFSNNQATNIQETGFPYPSEEFLATITEDQALQVISYIDVVNATYDWANMSEDEINAVLVEVRTDLHDLYLELGIEGPMTQTRTRTRAGKGGNINRTTEPRGNEDGTCIYDEVVEESPDEV